MRIVIRLSMVLLTFVLSATMVMAKGEVVEDGRQVKFEYTLTIDGEIIESSKGKQPLGYKHGEGQIIPGLAKEMTGLKVGDEKKVVVGPSDGYGEVVQEAFKEFPFSAFPDDFKAEEGMVLELRAPDGTSAPGLVWEVKEDTVVINFNHPLAGKTLTFDIKIVSIE